MVKKYTKKDRHWKSEKKKYQHPVASREHILSYLKEVGRPVDFPHMVTALLSQVSQKTGLSRRLTAMVRDGQLIRNRRGCYALVDDLGLVKGVVSGHKDGFGFVDPDDGSEGLYLSPRQMQLVFSNDRVLARVIKSKGRSEAVIVDVLERCTKHLVGRYQEQSGMAFVDPFKRSESKRIMLSEPAPAGVGLGDYVSVEILEQPGAKQDPVGRITEVLGSDLTPGLEIDVVARAYDLPMEWPEKVVQQLPSLLSRASVGLSHRRDLRDLPFVTIDGADAQDFDDAVYVKPEKGGWCLQVAIADVAHYIKKGSALDHEAFDRGNSVYFPGRVIPMLPEELSNDLCSLRPKEDRLVLVAEIHVSRQGEMLSFDFCEAIIHSHARLTYGHVSDYLGKKAELEPVIAQMIDDFYALYTVLFKQRQKRGALEFELPETQMVLDDIGKIQGVKKRERLESHRMIEEAMLMANVAATQWLSEREAALLYRVHDAPDAEKLASVRRYLKVFGVSFPAGKPTPLQYMKVLQAIRGRADAHVLETVVLRSLSQAIYSPNQAGHFGLAYEQYSHFTSPIRRYPDLIIHRQIKSLLRGKSPQYDIEDLEDRGVHCSQTERRADRCTRDAMDWLKCHFVSDKVGETFDGIIVDVTGFGIFVELADCYVTGLVHITALPSDYYVHQEELHRLVGRRTGRSYALGDAVRVLLSRVGLEERQIDLDMVSTDS